MYFAWVAGDDTSTCTKGSTSVHTGSHVPLTVDDFQSTAESSQRIYGSLVAFDIRCLTIPRNAHALLFCMV
eukprot:16683-Amphidinium_carterae.2